MAKYRLNHPTVDAYSIGTINPRDDAGNVIADVDGNVTLSGVDPNLAGTIPYTMPINEFSGFAPGDFIIVDENDAVSLVKHDDFLNNYHLAK